MSNKTPIIAALVANIAIAVAKGVGAFFSGSSAMVAEAYHSLSDAMNQVALLIGLRSSTKPPTEKHPFGHGKATYFWSFIVAVLLFGVAGTLSFREGIHKMLEPHPLSVRETTWALSVLGLAVVIETSAWIVSLKELRHKQHELKTGSLLETLRVTKDAPLVTIVVEDGLAVVGLLVAAAGVWLTYTTGDGRFDGAASALIGLILMGFALVLARRNRDLILGEAMSPDRHLRAVDSIEGDQDVRALVSLRSMHLSATDLLVAAEVEFRDGLDTDAVEAAIRRLETTLRAELPMVRTCYIEAVSRPDDDTDNTALDPAQGVAA